MNIAIEGNTGTGKTLIYNYIKAKGYRGIKEYSFYIMENNALSFPDFPPKNVTNLLKSHTTWSTIELLRYGQVSEDTKNYVLDRSLLSIFAFEYAKKQQGYIYDLKELSHIYLDLYNNGTLLIPNATIHLTTTSQNIIDVRTNLVNPFLYDKRTIADIDYFINTYGNLLCREHYFSINNRMGGTEELFPPIDNILDELTNLKGNCKSEVFMFLKEMDQL